MYISNVNNKKLLNNYNICCFALNFNWRYIEFIYNIRDNNLPHILKTILDMLFSQ